MVIILVQLLLCFCLRFTVGIYFSNYALLSHYYRMQFTLQYFVPFIYLFQQNTMIKNISDSRTGQQGTRVH